MKLRDITPKFENKEIEFDCIILGVSDRKTYVKKGTVECPSCHTRNDIECDKFRRIHIPRCTVRVCHGITKQLDPSTVITGYIQTIMIQEPIEEVENNSPIRFVAKLVDSDVGEAYMGQKKNVKGMFKTVLVDSKKNEFDINIEVIKMDDLDDVDLVLPTPIQIEKWNREKSDEGFLDKIIDSYAPHILGYRNIKKSILLHLVGGNTSKEIRGWINLFLVGDPGVAKTELLKFGEAITQKSVYTTGKGTTAAGLTAGMVKLPDGTSILQAGVYPLCNGGHVYVDEFDKMGLEDRSVMHTVMEHGEVTRAVAGINVRLPAKVATLAAANPKYGAYDPDIDFLENIDVPTPLLSRFDMTWLIIDKVDTILDTKKAQHILDTFKGKAITRSVYMSERTLMSYLNYVRRIEPTINDPLIDEKIKTFYNHLRAAVQKDRENIIPINPRHLQSLVRLSIAHAKLYLRDRVTVEDVQSIIELYEEMLLSFGKKLEESGFTQTTLSKKKNVEKDFVEAWCDVADDGGFVKVDELHDVLIKDFKWEEKQYNQYWYDMTEKKKDILQKGGRWKWQK